MGHTKLGLVISEVGMHAPLGGKGVLSSEVYIPFSGVSLYNPL